MPSFFACVGSFERIDAFSAGTAKNYPSDTDNYGFVQESHEPAHGIELTRATPASDCVFCLNGVTFEVPGAESPVLQNISLTIMPSTLSGIIGKVGSGKSMLLLGLLRELNSSVPFAHPVSGIAYCSQNPWLVNGTVKQNILGLAATSPDMEWYNTVVQACALDRDLQLLSDGDDTLIGSQGQTLSGGQKQRVVSYDPLNSIETKH